MSVLDRVRRAEHQSTATVDTPHSASISPAPANDPVITRLRSLIGFAVARVDESGGVPFFLRTLITEVMEELGELDGGDVASYMLYTSQIMRWVATGSIEDIPDELRDSIPQELRFALPAGTE